MLFYRSGMAARARVVEIQTSILMSNFKVESVTNNGDWKKVRLGEVAEVVGGGTPKTKVSKYWNGQIPWITPKDLSNLSGRYISRGERNISELGLSESSAKLLPKGTVLLTTRAPVGYLAIAENKVSTNQGFRSLIPNEKADNVFLFYLLKKSVEYLKSQSEGTTFGELSGSTLKSLPFLFPPILEQKAIAEILSSLDDKIDHLHRQNKTLENIAQTLFRKWFVEDAGKWEEKPLDEVADFLNGLACQKYPPENQTSKLPVLKIRELRNGISDSSDWATSKVERKYIIKCGDIIFSWSGSLMVKPWNGEKCVLNQHLFKVSSSQYPKWYVYLWTKHHIEKFIQIAESKATTMGHIKRSDLSSSMTLVPGDKELSSMNDIVSPLLEKIVSNFQKIYSLINLRDTLLPKLIGGEVKVKNISI